MVARAVRAVLDVVALRVQVTLLAAFCTDRSAPARALSMSKLLTIVTPEWAGYVRVDCQMIVGYFDRFRCSRFIERKYDSVGWFGIPVSF